MPRLTVKKRVQTVQLEPGEVYIVGEHKAARLLKRFKRFLVASQPGDEDYVPDWDPRLSNEERAAFKEKTWPLSLEERRKFKKPEAGKGPTVENRSGKPDHNR